MHLVRWIGQKRKNSTSLWRVFMRFRKNPRIGRPGWMEVSFKSTTGANGIVVRLDDSPQRFEGKSRVKGSITLGVITYGLGLLRTGSDVTLPEGTALVARVVD